MFNTFTNINKNETFPLSTNHWKNTNTVCADWISCSCFEPGQRCSGVKPVSEIPAISSSYLELERQYRYMKNKNNKHLHIFYSFHKTISITEIKWNNAVGRVPKYNRKILEIGKIDTILRQNNSRMEECS